MGIYRNRALIIMNPSPIALNKVPLMYKISSLFFCLSLCIAYPMIMLIIMIGCIYQSRTLYSGTSNGVRSRIPDISPVGCNINRKTSIGETGHVEKLISTVGSFPLQISIIRLCKSICNIMMIRNRAFYEITAIPTY